MRGDHQFLYSTHLLIDVAPQLSRAVTLGSHDAAHQYDQRIARAAMGRPRECSHVMAHGLRHELTVLSERWQTWMPGGARCYVCGL